MKKILFLTIAVALVIAFVVFDVGNALSLPGIKSKLAELQALGASNPLKLMVGFFAVYVGVTGLSLPGAAVLTLLAGALFGVVEGTILVSFASSIGATLAFLMSRYVLADSVQKRFGERLKSINAGIEKEGSFYLFMLRLVPIFPFFLVNVLMGLTPMSALRFYLTSQIGMLPGTLVYVNAGTQLATLDSLKGIASPKIIVSLALLGIFPLLAKRIANWLRARRVYARWKKPTSFDRNLVVIGAGAGGLVTAYIAAAVKAKVSLIEAHKMGGDCLNYGCVPSKALIKSARVAKTMREGKHFGLNALEPTFSFKEIMARVQAVVKAIEPHDSVARYSDLGVDVIQGYATIVDPWTVEIKGTDGNSQRLTTRSIVIATGAAPFIPPIPGMDQVNYVTSDTLWEKLADQEHAPNRMVVLGGGPIGCELAQAFARLGSNVTQVEMQPGILVREDAAVAELVLQSLQADGVTVLTGHKAVRCGVESGEQYLEVDHQGVVKRVQFDVLLCAVGRSARLKGYGLEALGIETHRTVVTNEYLETLYPNIFAAGDVVGPYQFTHVAAHQAWYAAVNALFGSFRKFKVDYSVIPWVTFTDPEIARVGLNESEAKEKGIAYELTEYGIDDLDRAICESKAHGFVRVLTKPGSDVILGATIAGEHAGELLAEFVLAMKHGLGLNKILGTIHSYPTWAESNKYVAGNWKRAHQPKTLLRWVERFHAWQRG